MCKKSVYLIAFLCFCLNLVCSRGEENYTVEIKDGVRYVHNNKPQWGDEPKVALEFVQKIGELESEDENYLLFRVSDVNLDSGGNIYIVDAENFRIQKYDPEGKYLATYGRKGQGPGEFGFPRTIDLDSDGNMYIYDQNKVRILVLSQDGTELRSFKFGKRAAEFRILKSGEFITLNVSGIPRDSFAALSEPITEYTLPVAQIYDKDGNLLREFGKPFDYKDIFVNTDGNNFYFSSDNNDDIYLSFRYQNRIEKYSSEGELLFTADRPLSYEISRPKTKITLSAEGKPTQITAARLNSVSGGIGVDHKGRIWVMTYRKQRVRDDPEPYLELEIYNNDGILLGEIPWAEEFIPARRNCIHIFGNRVFLFDLELISVYEYKIVEK